MERKNPNLLLDYRLFWNWLCCSRDYIFKGGKKPINDFPDFFHLSVYENAPYVNKPDNIIKNDPEKMHSLNFNLYTHYLKDQSYIKENTDSSSFGLFILKCFWDDFLYETVSPFHQESKVSYFARNLDKMEFYEDTVHYEITLNMDNHIGKACFIMPNVENIKADDNMIINARIFLPKLNLIFKGDENFQIIYNQNKDGIGFETNISKDPISKYQHNQVEKTENSKLDITNQNPDSFYFNKPFYIHVLIDNVQLLSLYVVETIQT